MGRREMSSQLGPDGQPTAAGADGAAGPTCFERFYTPKLVLAIFTLVNLMTYFDRGSIAATLSNIRSDSSIAGSDGTISETKGGFIVSVFMVGFMLACPVFASLGKYVPARAIIITGLAIWSVACFVTGLCKGYAMIVICRMFVGVGEAAYAGFFVTILDNIAPPAKRTMWIGIFYSMIPVGTAIGMATSGAMAEKAGMGSIVGWRIVFFTETIVSLPIIVLACMYPAKYNPTTVGEAPAPEGAEGPSPLPIAKAGGATAIDADRRSNDDATSASEGEQRPMLRDRKSSTMSASTTADQNGSITHSADGGAEGGCKSKDYADPMTAVKSLICNLDYILIVFGYGMYVFVTGAIAVWAISMLTQGPWRLGTIEASSLIGGVVAITGLAGSIAGGLFVDRMGGSNGASGVYKSLAFNTLMMVLAVPLGAGSMYVYTVPFFLLLFVPGVFFVFAITAPVTAAILSSVDVSVRTYAVSFSVLFIHLVGDFPSPTVTGALADAMDRGCSSLLESACHNATATDCYWVAAKENEKGHCVNTFETRNALVIVFLFLIFAIPAWAIAALRAKRRARIELDADTRTEYVNENVSQATLHVN